MGNSSQYVHSSKISSALSLASAEPDDDCFPFGQTDLFHSTVLPNLHVSVYYALTTFETAISPWMHPTEWLDANTKHSCAIFDGIVKCTENEAAKLPETKVFQVC